MLAPLLALSLALLLPDSMHLPTSCGECCTGGGGAGGMVSSANGKRLANMIKRRGYGAGELWMNKPPSWLSLNKVAAEHCAGDGSTLSEAIGGKSMSLEKGQEHPKGRVKPNDPVAEINFLADVALRGAGGLMSNANGKRLANKLRRRGYGVDELWKSKPPSWLRPNKAASDESFWNCKHSYGSGASKFYGTSGAPGADRSIPVSAPEGKHGAHYEAAGLVKPDDPNAKTKLLAAEMMRGVDGMSSYETKRGDVGQEL